MNRIELLQTTANTLLNDKNRTISADEYLTLISSAKTQEEKDLSLIHI